tara:strand:+ start:442 stop:648 length:207 start_codon:yes stop_codon:yes gene_type:complete
MDKLLNVKKPEFKVLDDEAKTETMGKLKVLEFLSEMITNMRESLTRELVVNDVEATDENTAKDKVKII